MHIRVHKFQNKLVWIVSISSNAIKQMKPCIWLPSHSTILRMGVLPPIMTKALHVFEVLRNRFHLGSGSSLPYHLDVKN